MDVKKASILIVDDDAISLTAMACYLRNSGYAVTTATGGRAALQHLSNPDMSFDVVLTDRIMPGIDGITLVRNMKSQAHLAEIPLIMMTGIAETEEKIEAIRAGVFDFLMKPIEFPLLEKVVQRALAKRDERDGGAAS